MNRLEIFRKINQLPKFSIVLLTVLTSVFLSGCGATSPYRSLPVEAKNKFTETHVIVIENNKPINAEFLETTSAQDATRNMFLPGEAPGRSLLAMLIDHSKDVPEKEKQEKALKKIQSTLNDFAFSNEFAKNLEAELSLNKWLNIKSSQVTNNVVSLLTNSLSNEKLGKAILVCEIDYTLSPSLRTLRIESIVSIYTKDKMLGKYGSLDSSDIENHFLLHRDRITHQHTLIGVEKNHQKAAMAWLSNNGQKLLKELSRGMKRVASGIVFNLEYINSRAN